MRINKNKRLQRIKLKQSIKGIEINPLAFNGWFLICAECVLADIAKQGGNNIDKRMLRLLSCIYELYTEKGFAYTKELSLLMGMDNKTVNRLIYFMTEANLLIRLPTKKKVIGIKTEVYGWALTGYGLSVMQDIKSSWSSLMWDLRLGSDITRQRMLKSK